MAVTPRRVGVIGGGVVGLSIAHDLARSGHVVTVVADRTAGQSVSAVAAAVWFPYLNGSSPSLTTWLSRSRLRFAELATDPATGVDLQEGTVVERRLDADRAWTEALGESREATPDELPVGAVAGVRATVPVVTTPQYLAWLGSRCEELGVHVVNRAVAAVDDLAGDVELVIVAAGMRSGELLGDDTMFPVRGQVVRLANPGITEWVVDDENPGGVTYVIPRRHDIVCGGVAEVASWDGEVDPQTERAILQRTAALVPALEGLPVVSRDVGLRPARATIRLEPVSGHDVPVIACYGHGGAGVTLSWGCAEAVTALAAEVAPPAGA